MLIELGRSFCGFFYYGYLWSQYNKLSFSNIRVAYNNLYRKILHVSPRSSASEMFADSNIQTSRHYFEKICFLLLLDYLFPQIRILERLKTVGS